MGRKADREAEQAYDAATVAILRALERKGKDREVLQHLSLQEQEVVFAAEARHMRRR